MNRFVWIVIAAALLGMPCAEAQLPAQGGASIAFSQSCATCHGNPNVTNAPELTTLRRMTPEAVYGALTSGNMRTQAQDLSDGVKLAITEYLTGRKPGLAQIADAKVMPNRCSGNPPIKLSGASTWHGWGADLGNSRFQTAQAAGLSPDQVPKLKLKWAFGIPGASVVYGQPTVSFGRVFVGVDTGYVYSLDAATGCVYWSFAAEAGVRNAIVIERTKGRSGVSSAAYFGDIRGNVYALNAETGGQLWKVRVDAHPAARITGTPTFYDDRLYVPVASMEEGAAGTAKYPCCSFRGSVVALDAGSGRQIWKTYTITEPLVASRVNSLGVQLWGPSGGGVWGSPAVDPEHDALYFGTGDAYSSPAPATTDALMALDAKTGEVLWSKQHTPNDAWITGCGPVNGTENCPTPLGPDYDFGAPVMLRTLPSGRLVIASQKGGSVWAHDADTGELKWEASLAPQAPPSQGELVWGGAADEQTAYFGLNSGGVVALHVADGSQKWFTPLEPAPTAPGHRGESGPLTVIAGVVFSGGWDGVIRALSAENGVILWQYDTAHDFQTVNGVAAKGGSMGAPGPTVAGGMLFVSSGYVGVQNGMPGNVVLAFSAH